MNNSTTPTGIYGYNGTELGIDDCPPEGANLTAWIMVPGNNEGTVLVDLRTVPNEVLEALQVEADDNGDQALVKTISGLLP